MSQQALKPLPIRCDPVNFADHNRELDGLIATKAMIRLLENVLSTDPMARAKINFSRGLYGYPWLTGQTTVSIGMRCERCLDEVKIEVSTDFDVLVKPEEENLPEKEDIKGENGPEFHEYDGKSLVISDLIEEELLLALPLVPKHQDISLCNQDMVAWLAANEAESGEQKASSERKESPFAILKSVD